MCWSYSVSLTFALFETISLFIIVGRAIRILLLRQEQRHPSTAATTTTTTASSAMVAHQIVCPQQLYLVPLLCTVLWVETMETLLWKERDQLVDIDQAPGTISISTLCTTRNRNLTVAIFFGAIVWQPFWAIFACRRTGYTHHNRNQLRIPEYLAAAFGIVAVGLYVYTQWNVDPSTLPTLRQHGYRSYMGRETCTYIGKHGHLQWSIAMIEQWTIALGNDKFHHVFHIGSPISPQNYILLAACAVILAKPWHLFAGMIGAMEFLFLWQEWYMDWSFEAASVWCWSGILVHIYCLLQPYLLTYMASTSPHHGAALLCPQNYYNHHWDIVSKPSKRV
jgi:hypothetical protein